jgi:vesicular inhibitory amino acid transporter
MVACTILMFVVIAASNYTSRILVLSMQENPDDHVSDPHIFSYVDLGRYVLGPFGHFVVSFSVNVTLFSVAVLFLILAGTQLYALVSSFAPLSPNYYILICAVVCCGLSFFPTIAHVGFISLFGLIATVFVCFAVLICSFYEMATEGVKVAAPVVNFNGLGVAFGILAFSFGSHAVHPEIAVSLHHPYQWRKVIALSLFFASCLYFPVGTFGSLAYGSKVDPVVLASLGTNDFTNVLTKIALAFIVIHVISAFPAVLHTPFAGLEDLLRLKDKKYIFTMCVRTLVVAFCAGLAIVFQDTFGAFLGFVGSGTVTLTAFICPPWFYMVRMKGRMSLLDMVLCISVIVFGLAAGVVGVMGSVGPLVDAIHDIGNKWR